MKAIRFIPIILLFMSLSLNGQTEARYFERDCDDRLICSDFEQILDRLISYLGNDEVEGDGAKAFQELKALEACDKCPEHRDNIDSLSSDIIQLFAKQNQKLKDQRGQLTKTITDLDRVLRINEQTTRESLVDNYILRLARSLYKEQINEYDPDRKKKTQSKVLWLTDFAYAYVDSTHYEVKKMMYDLYYDQVIGNLPEGYFESYYEGDNTLDNIEIEATVNAIEGSPDEQWLAVGLSNGRLLIFDKDGNTHFDFPVSTQHLSTLTWSPKSDQLAFVVDGSTIGFLNKSQQAWEQSSQAYFVGSSLICLRWANTVDNYLAVGDAQGNITVFDVAQNSTLHSLEGGHQDWVRDIAWSPDDSYFAACDDTGTILIWDWKNGKVHRSNFAGHTDYARAVDWHPDGHTIISGGDDYQLIFWDTLGAELDRKEFNDGWIYRARYNADGTQIGLRAGSTFYKISGEEYELTELPNGVTSFSWLGSLSTAIASDGRIVDFNEEAFFSVSSRGLSNLSSADIKQLGWSPSGRYLAFAKENKLFIASEGELAQIDFETAEVLSLTWRPNGLDAGEDLHQLAVSLSNNNIFLLDVETMSISQNIENQFFVPAISWSPDGQHLAAGTDGGDLVLLNDQLQKTYQIALHENYYIYSVAWSPNGQFVATGASDYTVAVFDMEKRQLADRFGEHYDWIREVLWLDNQHFVTASDDSRSLIWRFPREQATSSLARLKNDQGFPKELDDLSGYLYSLAFYPLPKNEIGFGYLAVGSGQNQIGLYHLDDGFGVTLDTVLNQNASVYDLDWLVADGKRPFLTIGKRDQIPRGLELSLDLSLKSPFPQDSLTREFLDYGEMRKLTKANENEIYLPRLSSQAGQYKNLCWSADERLLALINEGGGIEIHDMELGQQIHEQRTNSPAYEQLVFSPDTKHLVSTRYGEEVSVWGLRPTLDSTVFHINDEVADWTWSADSRYLYILDGRFGIHRYDTRVQEVILLNSELIIDNALCDGAIIAHPKDSDRIFVLAEDRIHELNPSSNKLTVVYKSYPRSNDQDYCIKLEGSWLQDGALFVFQREDSGPQFLRPTDSGFTMMNEAFDPNIHHAWCDMPTSVLCEIYHIKQNDDNLYNDSDRSVAEIWDLESHEVVMVVEDVKDQMVGQLEASKDGRYFATLGPPLEFSDESQKYRVSGEAYISLWETRTQQEIMVLVQPDIDHFELSPRGGYLVTYHSNGNLGLWPLDIVDISQYMRRQGKDDFLRSSSAKNAVTLKDQMKDWRLEKGMAFRGQENLRQLQQREQPIIRDNWSRYYVDRAWLSLNETDREDYFVKAADVHLQRRGKKIIPTYEDSLALSDVYMERVYASLKDDDIRQGLSWLQQARSINISRQRLEATDKLLAWWRNPERPVAGLLSCLLDGICQTELQAEFNRWQARKLNIPRLTDLRRIMALGGTLPDPESPLYKPLMEDLLQGYPEAETQTLLFRYFRVNTFNPNFRNDNEREAFIYSATKFWEERFDIINQDEQLLIDYLEFSDNLQRFTENKGKWARAFDWAGKKLKTVRLIRELDPDNTTNQSLYERHFADYQKLNLQLNPDEAPAVSVAISKLLNQSTDSDPYSTILLHIRKGHAELLARKKLSDVMVAYYQALSNESFDFGSVSAFILNEIGQLDTKRRTEIETAFEEVKVFSQTNSEFLEKQQFNTLFDPDSGELNLSLESCEELYQLAVLRVNKAEDLSEIFPLPEQEMASIIKDEKEMLGNYAYLALNEGEWPLFKDLANTGRIDYPDDAWPLAFDAVSNMLDGNWSAAKASLRKVDGVTENKSLRGKYPLLVDLLKNLPESVKATTQYQEVAKQWMEVLGE